MLKRCGQEGFKSSVEGGGLLLRVAAPSRKSYRQTLLSSYLILKLLRLEFVARMGVYGSEGWGVIVYRWGLPKK